MMTGFGEARRQGRVRIIRTTGRVPRPEEVLVTTPPWDVYRDDGFDVPCLTADHLLDWFATHPLSYPKTFHRSGKGRTLDLAFLSANVPGPTYLEVPDQQTIVAHLGTGRYKVLAISCYTWTLPWALELAHRAKETFGVEETWLGNYGVMTPDPRVEQRFDRLFAGYTEAALREIFGMAPFGPSDLVHPDLTLESTYLGQTVKVGQVIWQRGCTQQCTFCADPVYQPGGEGPLSVESVRRIIEHYRESGCISVHLVNQDVRPFSSAGRKVIELLKQYQMPFSMMASFAAIMAKGREGLQWLREMGCTMVQPGIESLDDTNLAHHHKSTTVGNIERSVALLEETGIRLNATYMICFEHDTVEGLRRAQRRLGDLGPLYTHFNIVQPMPGTAFYDDLARRGLITDLDWRRWTNGYLVWKHPTIRPDEARELLLEMDQTVNTGVYNRNLRREWSRAERLQKRLLSQGHARTERGPITGEGSSRHGS
jgi:hypothetical protein